MPIKTTPKWDEHWQALTRLVELEDGFYLIFIMTDETQTVTYLQDQLKQRFRCTTIATPAAATEQLYYDVVKGLGTQIDAANAETEVVLIDLHRYLVNEPMKVLLARLNERREWLRNGLKIPLILILSPQMDVGRYAPDFWSVRDLVLFFDDTLTHEKPAPIQESGFMSLWHAFTDWFSGIQHRYFQQITYEHRFFNIKGLRTRGEYNVELEQVFVELHIAPSANPNQLNRHLLTVEELQGSQPIWEFLRYGRKRTEQLLLAIIGAPGCGKTTVLQHLALLFADKQASVRTKIDDNKALMFINNVLSSISSLSGLSLELPKWIQLRVRWLFPDPIKLPKWIPILLFLRQHVKTILSERPALADLAQQHFSDSKRSNLQPPPNWFQRQLNAGNCLILLDGLDEVANAEERKQISTWIDEQSVHYPLCPLIVTSRPQGYHAAPLSRATMLLEVQAFSSSQVKQFINAWYLATEIMSYGGKDDPGVRLRAKQEAEDLQLRLQTRPALVDLTVNPLLLTMIAMVHRYRGQLPGRRVELYAEICDVLLGHWREAKGIQDSLTAAQKRVALQPLAAWMMEHEVREIEIAQALEVIREPLQMLGVKDGKEFLQDIQASSGLFSEREMNVWSFAHLTFQEYLAAAHYKDQKIHGNWWHRKVADSWWHETLLLYAAQADATPIVKSCLNSKTLKTLSLAADCLDEALQLDAAVRQQVETVLIENLESDDPELFKLAAEVKLQRRLRNLQRIDEKTEIDQTFISCAEYQLFLDEMRDQGIFYQPDHWTEFHFPKGSALQPVAGVRAQDAKEFCTWLSQKENKKYRCPTLAEAQEFSAVENHKLATWCHFQRELQWYNLEIEKSIELEMKKLFSDSWIENQINSRTFTRCFSLRSRNFAHIFDLCHDIVLDLDNILINHNLSHTLSQILAQTLDHKVALNRISSLRELLEFQQSGVFQELDILAIQQCLQNLQPTNEFEYIRNEFLISLFDELSVIFSSNNYFEQQQAWYRCIAHAAKYSAILTEVFEKMGDSSKNNRLNWRQLFSLWKQIFWQRKEVPHNIERNISLYAWAKIVEARLKGKLPAWEGIRIVRKSDV
jgi:energy-coupling factor transporter ATP-binding protein EcfA2